MATTMPMAVTLLDGTRVYLHKNARLTYPESFQENERAVTLTGKAFFEVSNLLDRGSSQKTAN